MVTGNFICISRYFFVPLQKKLKSKGYVNKKRKGKT